MAQDDADLAGAADDPGRTADDGWGPGDPASAGDPGSGADLRWGDRRHRERRSTDARLALVRDVLAGGGPKIEFQPLLSLTRLEVAGYEALARFPAPAAGERRRAARPDGTEQWLAVGRAVGLGVQVEASALARALDLGAARPPGTLLSVNLSPSSLGTPEVEAALPDDLTGVEVELTENEAVDDLADLRRRLAALRERGALVAVDDVGAGYAGLRRVMDLAPDTVKLDRHLVDGVAGNGATAALVRAVVHLADHIGARVCAEGVESAADLVALAELDVARAQGYFVGRPAAVPGDVDPEAVAACAESLDRLFAGPPAGPATAPDRAVAAVLGRLGDVRTAAMLDALLGDAARALDCSALELHQLPAGDAAVMPLTADPGVRARLRAGTAVPLWGRGDGGRSSAALLVPVRSRGETTAVLACTLDAAAPWSRRQIASVRLVASVVGPVLALLRDA